MSDGKKHARFGASGAYKRALCPGSVQLCSTLPSKSSKYADEGTAAHEVLELMLKEGIPNADTAFANPKFANTKPITDLWAVEVAYQHLAPIAQEAVDGGGFYNLEARVEFPSEFAPGECFGTADFIAWNPQTGKLTVADYKHGAGVAVYAKGNKQLAQYGVGAAYRLLQSAHATPSAIDLIIVQPRAQHKVEEDEPITGVLTWSISAEELDAEAGQLDQEILACLDPEAPLVPGTVQCRFCNAIDVCPARRKNALKMFDGALDIPGGGALEKLLKEAEKPRDLTDEEIVKVMESKKELLEWLERVEESGIERIRSGKAIPGLKLVTAKHRRYWEPWAKPDLIQEILPAVTLDEVAPRSLISITEMDRLLAAKTKHLAPASRKDYKACLDSLMRKKAPGTVHLALVSDARPDFVDGTPTTTGQEGE